MRVVDHISQRRPSPFERPCFRQCRPLSASLRNTVFPSRQKRFSGSVQQLCHRKCWKRSEPNRICSASLPRQQISRQHFQEIGCKRSVRTFNQRLQICRSSSKDVKEKPKSSVRPLHVLKYFIFFGLGAGVLFLLNSSRIGAAFRSSVMSSWLGRSGFVAALSLIFLSEVGDKTFFICAILAMRLGRWISFLGTILALNLMTVLSVGLGVAFNAIPDAMRTSIPIGKYLSVALLFFFGARSILNGVNNTSQFHGDERADAEETIAHSKQVSSEDSSKKLSHSAGLRGYLKSIFVVAALIFVAEWGDRSMLTTIALGASQNPLGVALGGSVGHILAAIIAVVGGSFISRFISENTVNLVSGILFVVFAITTALNWT